MRRAVVTLAILLLILAVRTLVVGYTSYTPLVFAQLYLLLFTIVATIPVFVRIADSPAGDHVILLLVSGAIAIVMFAFVAPQIGEPNYCGGRYLLWQNVRVPTLYRCTPVPFAVFGWFAGLWTAIWSIEWWTGKLDVPSASNRVPVRRSFLPTVVAVVAVALLVAATATMFIGTRTLRQLILAEVFLLLFTLFMAVPTLIRGEKSGADQFVLYSAALVGAVLAWNLAPEVGGPNFCLPLPRSWQAMRDILNDVSRSVGVVPPTPPRLSAFRCTTLPFAVAGGFAGWWIVLWLTRRRKSVMLQ